MQTIQIICLGKLNAKYFADGCSEYIKRLGGMCNIVVTELAEENINEKNESEALVARALEKEGEKILANVRKGSTIISLCIEGKQMSSEKLAEFFEEKALSGNGDITFVIGSSHGLSPVVKQASAVKMSMSQMTFPHQLARLMLLEQVYRAMSINKGTKYHK
ncbi:MAG: 23S rRNA (pseudouridine(1915)-N(3))-methyltransferase RlmH [Oscillospiraceae bacterium]|nr:23S rRNA (pseudouridine(1915)-N(3))-methyltransferase RlmH [Oscillospiraceae bacterium]